MAMAGVVPPFDAGAFFATEQATLSDTLTPHLDAYDLSALACVARTFRAWPTLTHRKCRLAPRHKFEPHGHRDGQPVMLKKRLIKVDVLVLEKYTSASGRQWPRMVAPAAQVDLANSMVDVELVSERTGEVVENLFHNKLFKYDSRGRKESHGYKWRPVKAYIHETLSADHPPPATFRLRTTAHVARLGRSDHCTYSHLSRPFGVFGHA